MKKNYYILFLANLIWTIAAFIYDLPIISSITFYYWPFIIICPIYPFLLAIFWLRLAQKKSVNDYLLAFSALPSVIYLFAALIYYPTWMIINSFDLLAFGQIFWVAFYGGQGIYLLLKYKIPAGALSITGMFVLASFIIQYRTMTFGYFDFSNFGDVLFYEYLSLFLITVGLCISLYWRNKRLS